MKRNNKRVRILAALTALLVLLSTVYSQASSVGTPGGEAAAGQTAEVSTGPGNRTAKPGNRAANRLANQAGNRRKRRPEKRRKHPLPPTVEKKSIPIRRNAMSSS